VSQSVDAQTSHSKVDAIRQYSILEEKEDYLVSTSVHPPELDPALAEQSEQTSESRSNLRLFPPPLFSRQNVPQNYKRVLLLIQFSITDQPIASRQTLLRL
jgi:hypothetical protein